MIDGRGINEDGGKINAAERQTKKHTTSFGMILFPVFCCYWPVGKT